MINYEHNEAWTQNFCRAIDTTFSVLKTFGIGETKNIPSIVAPEVKDESSSFHRFLEVFYDEALLDAELSLAAEEAGNKKGVYHDHAKNKKQRMANRRRLLDVLHASVLYCRMSREYGVEFAMVFSQKLNSSYAHLGFLEEFYDSVMLAVRLDIVLEKSMEDAGDGNETCRK